ncbi:TetR/AcrR family transcriptional regulator [Streptomyces acidiscabies]|uniref:TetR family transcriptional regulator n=1 Tax=Streptomyces acidiscabies TaxID=42234 RepID=A0AAP6BKQ6_9ACTN|nr:TetR family transcriptional regulator [Streptomyces acidiscabies]MBZ3918106.1 TetR/AcrR family transcriptional regulator [Streptomyces acidiscabies]MDX2966549.1 TetR family transcriptional regulator [Streptomyces acidiscabies]MDX3021965.1 TetR family transcriptional regulator [Streptomyces acidiscabies]MDX3789622.1 TetR family transcriptional regulator [Streptomyces acidiscabies]GAQ50608.1 putative HTH-type transcriptional regulator [Streptomyces acidiscabies]
MAHVSAAERRPQLIKAAIDLMTREGVSAGSTRAIATELGVAQATVHYTFGTKEGLYRAVMEQLTAELLAQVEQAAPEDAGFEETVSTLASALWNTVREKPGHHLLLSELSMFALRTPALNEALESHYRGVVEATARLVTQAAERTGQPLSQPAETVARFFLSGFDGLVMQRLTHPDEEAEATCLQAFIAAVVALARGQLTLTAVPAS